MAGIGMSVPGATDLGLGMGPGMGPGTTLTQQVGQETDEERRRRLLQEQQQRLTPGASLAGASNLMTGYSAALPGA